jgi:uncharacterized protein (TIGR02145 family)
MAENLNYNATGSKCYAEGVSGVSADSINKNCETYGRLYDWATAMGFNASCNTQTVAACGATVSSPHHRGVCPSGWHLPSDAEWTTLTNYVESNKSCTSCAHKYLKAIRGYYSGNGTDDYGFSALPGGYGISSDGSFNVVDFYGYWWSSTEGGVTFYAYYRSMGSINPGEQFNSGVFRQDRDKANLYSVRCVKDQD